VIQVLAVITKARSEVVDYVVLDEGLSPGLDVQEKGRGRTSGYTAGASRPSPL
jgi:hypothetical protein